MCSWTDTYGEPPLAELLNEPIIAALMTSDGVDRAWLETLIAEKGEAQGVSCQDVFA